MIPEYLKLLIRRESRDVLGRNWMNLWLLTAMLFAMYLAIAFSNGSMDYLEVKMNDPFTNWVNIKNGYGSALFNDFTDCLGQDTVKSRFHISDVQSDYSSLRNFQARSGNVYMFDARYFEKPNSSLIKAILNNNNVVGDAAIDVDRIDEKTFGFIFSRDALEKLGYSTDSIPAYVRFHSNSVGADTLGFVLDSENYAAAPVPVLAVVDRLPDNKEVVGSKYFYEQSLNSSDYTLSLNHEDYQRSLLFFVSENIGSERFEELVAEAMPDSLKGAYQVMPNDMEGLRSWRPGTIMSVYLDDENTLPLEVFPDIASRLDNGFDVVRLFNYSGQDHSLPESQYVSVNFLSLDSIRSFESFARQNFGVEIEMSQVNAKENFNEVSILASVLSWAMIVFSVVCIIIFLANTLQSYFKKVSRNIGTFKAFGMDSGELVRAYEVLLMVIVVSAMISSLLLVWLIQILLPVFGVLKNGEYSYLSLWSFQTLSASVVVIVAMSLTVWLVMGSMLRKTPGDLIYDR